MLNRKIHIYEEVFLLEKSVFSESVAWLITRKSTILTFVILLKQNVPALQI